MLNQQGYKYEHTTFQVTSSLFDAILTVHRR